MSVATGLVLIPGAVALLVLLVFSYLYEQNRHSYFRAWQMAWAAYTLHYALEAVELFSRAFRSRCSFSARCCWSAMAMCIFVSTRLMKEPFQLKWYDVALMVRRRSAGLCQPARAHGGRRIQRECRATADLSAARNWGWQRFCSIARFIFTVTVFAENSVAFRTLAFSLALWAALMGAGQFRQPFLEWWDKLGGFLGRFRKCCWPSRW